MWKGQAGPLLPPSAWQKGGGCSSKGVSSSECTSCVLKVVTSGTGGAGQVFSTKLPRSEQGSLLQLLLRVWAPANSCQARSCDCGCCITAVEPPGLNQLQRGCLWCLTRSQSAIPAFSYPPFPLCLPAWDDSLMDSFWGCLWVTHSSCWWEQNKHSSKAQAETKSRIVYAAEIFSV